MLLVPITKGPTSAIVRLDTSAMESFASTKMNVSVVITIAVEWLDVFARILSPGTLAAVKMVSLEMAFYCPRFDNFISATLLKIIRK